eukprot:CAMPEP_0117085120 /NCGR_PEP_ID=MMETSP0472-20121206/59874_1 /TAXON_ID=693140 ORGANISM="Tiarina fusus, Strain LIS" /NCGR_SAMPLE_ID=MMETSP0472 /ASSEMBLY_ACC=CAM_ASM_000603 /LENGTH=179 /DNA_ID=CAMNT_0004814319 /DNA_START=128 /DNA_END=664 /DNA_ORIENTATION=+
MAKFRRVVHCNSKFCHVEHWPHAPQWAMLVKFASKAAVAFGGKVRFKSRCGIRERPRVFIRKGYRIGTDRSVSKSLLSAVENPIHGWEEFLGVISLLCGQDVDDGSVDAETLDEDAYQPLGRNDDLAESIQFAERATLGTAARSATAFAAFDFGQAQGTERRVLVVVINVVVVIDVPAV